MYRIELVEYFIKTLTTEIPHLHGSFKDAYVNARKRLVEELNDYTEQFKHDDLDVIRKRDNRDSRELWKEISDLSWRSYSTPDEFNQTVGLMPEPLFDKPRVWVSSTDMRGLRSYLKELIVPFDKSTMTISAFNNLGATWKQIIGNGKHRVALVEIAQGYEYCFSTPDVTARTAPRYSQNVAR